MSHMSCPHPIPQRILGADVGRSWQAQAPHSSTVMNLEAPKTNSTNRRNEKRQEKDRKSKWRHVKWRHAKSLKIVFEVCFEQFVDLLTRWLSDDFPIRSLKPRLAPMHGPWHHPSPGSSLSVVSTCFHCLFQCWGLLGHVQNGNHETFSNFFSLHQRLGKKMQGVIY